MTSGPVRPCSGPCTRRPGQVRAARAALVAEQRARLLRHMVAGNCEPRDVRRLLAGLEAGLSEGARRAGAAPDWPDLSARPPFRRFLDSAPDTAMLYVGGWSRASRDLLERAQDHVSSGGRASVVLVSPGFRRHFVTFTHQGVWVQQGGLLGRSERDRKVLEFSPKGRIAKEHSRRKKLHYQEDVEENRPSPAQRG